MQIHKTKKTGTKDTLFLRLAQMHELWWHKTFNVFESSVIDNFAVRLNCALLFPPPIPPPHKMANSIQN